MRGVVDIASESIPDAPVVPVSCVWFAPIEPEV